MKLIQIITELEYFIESQAEAGIVLKGEFSDRFACKVKGMERDPEKKVGYYVEFARSSNTSEFPSEGQTFRCGINEIKSVGDL